jgi:isopentenyl-diphosphate delta-isomerase
MLQIVDEAGTTIGRVGKLQAHENGGVWHRAISVMLFNDEGRLLLQRRSEKKYHFANLWANSCCSHPINEESPSDAARRAMAIELGVSSDILEITHLVYEAHDSLSGLTEKEYDHLFVGDMRETLRLNPDEVSEVRWVSGRELSEEIKANPEKFVPWLPRIMDRLKAQEIGGPTYLRNFLLDY